MMRRNKPLEAHNRVYQNKPIGSQLLVGINPPKKKFPRHSRYVPVPVKRKYYRQSNNGFMIMGQPTAQPPLSIEAITKIISGLQMREPQRANPVQNIPAPGIVRAPENRSYEQTLSDRSGYGESSIIRHNLKLNQELVEYMNELREIGNKSESSVASPFYPDDISSITEAPEPESSAASPFFQDDISSLTEAPEPESSDGSLLRDLEDYKSVPKYDPIPSGPEPPDPEPILESEPLPAPISIPEPEIPADDDDFEERSGVAGISYGAMTVAMMKTELRAAGLKVSGNRADLIERLKVYKRKI